MISEAVTQAFVEGNLGALQREIQKLSVETREDGARVIPEFLGATDCVRYTDHGIEFQTGGRTVAAPAPHEVIIFNTSVSLCGTDIDLIGKAQRGELPKEAIGKVVGHEAAGFVVGVGAEVTGWEIGALVCLDSHFACGQGSHGNFDACVHSGKSCDGIVGGIRGSIGADGARVEPLDGYWSRVMNVPVSALPKPLPVETAVPLAAPSTLESLGNIYMIVEQLEAVGLLKQPERTALIVSGLGATGYPMAAVARHYGFKVVGINPSESKRILAEEAGACEKTFATTAEAEAWLQEQVTAGAVEHVVVAVMSGNKDALGESLALLHKPLATGRRACVVFGLFGDATAPMPEAPLEFGGIAQRDFVFSRKNFTTEDGVEVYGVCGRDLRAWEMVLRDLEPKNGVTPALVERLNRVIHTMQTPDPLRSIAEALNQGPAHVNGLLREAHALKLAANLLKAKNT